MKSGIQGLIFTFIATLTIYAIIKSNISQKNLFSMRFLKNIDELRDDFCDKASDELKEFYPKTSPDYDFTPNTSNELLQRIMKDFLTDSSSAQNLGVDEVKEYFSKSPGYILILVLFIILCILFVPYVLCVCCKCCCCIPEGCLKCQKLYIIAGIVFCGLALINCFIGYSKNSSIVDGVYGLGCSILKIEYHLIYGDEYKSEKPFWAGIRGIIDKLNDASKNITALKNQTLNIKTQLNINATQFINEFRVKLNNEYDTRTAHKVPNPDPSQTDFITPLYFNLYGPRDNQDTCLGKIDYEMDKYTSTSSNSIYEVLDIISEASENTEFIDQNIDLINENIETNVNSINSGIGDKISEYESTLDDIDSYSRRIMNSLFSVNLVLVLAVGASLILLLLCKFGLFILCFSWFLVYILMLLTFFLGAVFGLIGSFVQDASAGVKYLIDNIDSEDIKMDAQIKEIAQICLKGNGSLAHSSLIPINFDTSIIENVYSLEKNIDNATQLIKNYEPLSTAANLEMYNIMTKKKEFLQELETPLKNIRKYIDFSEENTKVNSNTKIYDNWEINETECREGYKYCKKDDSTIHYFIEETENDEKCCLIITEWGLNEIKMRYENIEPKETITPTVENYYNSIMSYINENELIKNEIISQNEDFEKDFKTLGDNIIGVLKNILDLFKPLRQGFDEIIGNNAIFEILNCKFIKRDINKVIEELYNSFGDTFKSTSTLLLMISAYELAMTLIILAIMKSFKQEKTTNNRIN
jgi:hypothetical protein